MEKINKQSLPPSSSIKLLQGVVGKRVTGLVRYSWWPKEEVANECGIADDSAFSFTYGPLGVAFEDGTVVGVAEQPSLNSVVVWLDRHGGSAIRHPAMDEDTDFFSIDATDRQFSNRLFAYFIGAKLIKFTVLKPRSMNALLNELPSEIGLCFVFENGHKLIAAHGLHQESGDFAVIGSEQIPATTYMKFVEQALV